MRNIIIFGSNGQDGKCLIEYLANQNVNIIKIDKNSKINLLNKSEVENLIKNSNADEIFFLAAFHHSSEQKIFDEFDLWQKSIDTHLTIPSIILESIRLYSPKTRFFYAGSSLIFGNQTGTFNEQSIISPDNTYGITKAAGISLCQYYKTKYNLFCSVGILFNHESEYRDERFLTRKIVKGISKILKQESKTLTIGSLETQVDWGYARDYVEAMSLILNLQAPDTFIISSGKTHSTRDFVKIAFEKAGLDYQKYIVEDPNLLQRKIPYKLGDNSKLKNLTGWHPKTTFDALVEIMLKSEGIKFE